jgi:hypothetical protein
VPFPVSSGPYKAAQSYGPADGDLFFGRDAEGTALTRFLIDRRIAVLTAPSGIGKTSLLHAKVIPLLEKERWFAACARPKHDPIQSLREALLDCLMPNPSSEAEVVDQLAERMLQRPPLTLRSALSWYMDLSREERSQFRLFRPPLRDDFVALPMICRALRGSISCEHLIEHFEALAAAGPCINVTPHTTLRDLAQSLRSPVFAKLWREWRHDYNETRDSKLIGAVTFVEDQWLPLRPALEGIVLIVDQFEELFTRLPRNNLDELLEECTKLVNRTTSDKLLPVHVAFSLRKEFFADLVRHLREFGSIERLTFFVGKMRIDQARAALSKPAALFGIEFAQTEEGEGLGCLDRILKFACDEIELNSSSVREDQDYSPALISLLGAHLWNRLQTDPAQQTHVTWTAFQKLVPNIDNVFESFLSECLERIERTANLNRVTQFDVLELLDRLVTTTGFRNIVSEDDLIDQLPLRPQISQLLLNAMDHDLKLVRRESRRGGRFVEIMHEQLIAPARRMLTKLRLEDFNRAALFSAYDMLYMLPDVVDPTSDPLPAHFREALYQHLNRLELDQLAAKILLRSLLVAGPASGDSKVDGPEWDSWSDTINLLASTVSDETKSAPNRMALMSSGAVVAELATLLRRKKLPNADAVRHIALSALGDRNETASSHIWRVFPILANLELQR